MTVSAQKAYAYITHGNRLLVPGLVAAMGAVLPRLIRQLGLRR